MDSILNKHFILCVQASYLFSSLCKGEHIGFLRIAYCYLEFQLRVIFITLRKPLPAPPPKKEFEINSISNSRFQPVPKWAINWTMMKLLPVQVQCDLGTHPFF